jgi:L-alanine-DL-glutamate epimerase-like enolase superfamily enzyme
LRITELRTHLLAIPHKVPYEWALGAPAGTNNVLLEVQTDDGLVGYGDISGTRSARAAAAVVRWMAPLIVGEDPFRIEHLLATLYKRGNWSNQRRFANQVIAGIEMALFDIMGKAVGQPACNLLGGKIREEISWFGFLQGNDPTAVAAQAQKYRSENFSVVYLKVGLSPERDWESVSAVRQTVGTSCRIRIDANEAWGRTTAIHMIKRLAEFDLDWGNSHSCFTISKARQQFDARSMCRLP